MQDSASSEELSEVLRDLADTDGKPAEALALAEAHLAREPGDADILGWRIRLLERMGRRDEARAAFEPYKAAILSRQPQTLHRWQELGFALHWQARICRALGRKEEARQLILEAVARIGSFLDHPAWLEAAQWLWEDGHHDAAGRLWHDAMFKGCGGDAMAAPVLEATAELGDDHAHDWVWLARMRAMLSGGPGLSEQAALERIETMFRHVEHQPMAWRIRARARARSGDLEAASADLDHYLALGGDPRAQIWRVQLDHHIGREHGLEQVVWKRVPDAGGRDYYAAGCDVMEFIEELQAEGFYTGADDFARARLVEAEVYKLGAERFEHYFATGEGNSEDADPHVYAMLCNNLGTSWGIRQERFLEGIAWHDKGWAASQFWEQYSNRLRNQLHAGQWQGVVESYEVLRRTFGTSWDFQLRLNGVAHAYDQLGRHDDVLALYEEFADWCWQFEAAAPEVEEEENQIGLLLRTAKAAARRGRDDLLREVTGRLLASDRLTPNMATFLAEVWTDHGDPAEAARCRQAIAPSEPPALQATPELPDFETLQRIHQGVLLNSGYGALTLAAADEDDWHFVTKRYLPSAGGGSYWPVAIEAQRGPEPGVPTWQASLVEEQAGWLARLGGRKVNRRVQLSHCPTGPSDDGELQGADETQIKAFWPEFLRRYHRADQIWRQLSATITIERIKALLAELEAAGYEYGHWLSLGTCQLRRTLINGRQELSLCFDRCRDGDPARPNRQCDFYYYRYQLGETEKGSFLSFIYQDKNNQSARDIEPGDPDLALASLDHFQRMTRRLERWRKDRQA